MAKRVPALPPPAICILDANPEVARALRSSLESIARSIRLVAFGTHEEAKRSSVLKTLQQTMEPCVLVTDRVGTEPVGRSFVDEVRHTYPLMRIVLYSHGTTDEEAQRLAWQWHSIDDFVRKPHPKKLRERVA